MRPSRILILLALLNLSACGQHDRETLVLTGSSTLGPMMSDIAADFEAANPGVRIDVQTGGSSRGIADVRRGTADLGMISRELRPDESDLSAHVVARDGISLIVHADNPLSALGNEQVAQLFRGEISNWGELTDHDVQVTIVHKGQGRATLDVFLAHFDLNDRDVRAHLIVGENQQAIRSVAGNRGAIGYVSIGAALHEQELGTSIRIVSIEGISPDADAVARGIYPLTRNLNLVSRGTPGDLASEFLRFARSGQGDIRVREHFFVPAAEEPAVEDHEG
ncbi:MAG: phosphate ABC transporter substrate-binding protein [Wenzhouxiangella sp.]